MAEKIIKKTTKKVIKRAVGTRLNKDARAKSGSDVAETQVGSGSGQRADVKSKKVCLFCQSGTLPFYTDVNTLRRFLTERQKIVPKLRSGLCSKHQRRLTTQVKYARHLALLPFTPKV